MHLGPNDAPFLQFTNDHEVSSSLVTPLASTSPGPPIFVPGAKHCLCVQVLVTFQFHEAEYIRNMQETQSL